MLQGQELLTSNMMVSFSFPLTSDPSYLYQVFPMATIKRVIPWWSLPLNWLIGIFVSTLVVYLRVVALTPCTYSLLRESRGKLVLRSYSC